jgi:hypothetical protein
MHHLTIVAEDRTGLLVALSSLLAEHGIDIADIKAKVHGANAVIQLEVDRHEDSLRVLTEDGYHVVADDSVLVQVADQPGALANLTRRLTDAHIDIRAIRLVQRHANCVVISIDCDRNADARTVLSDILVR